MRSLLWFITWTLVLGLLGLLAARLFAHDRAWALVILNGFTEIVYAPAWIAAALALAARRWGLLLAASPLCLWHLSQVGPLFLPKNPPPACGPELVLWSGNLYAGNADKATLLNEIEASDADILMLQEVTPPWKEALTHTPFSETYPSRVEHIQARPTGSAIWSREPLRDKGTFELGSIEQTMARVKIGAGLVDLYNVHPLPPLSPELWPVHTAMMEELLERVGQLDRPFIVAGDFNSTGHAVYASRLRVLASDAWEMAGRGFGFTWPARGHTTPPMRIDHIWVSPDLTVREITVGTGAGSDHHPLRAVLAPRQGGRLATEGCKADGAASGP